MKKEIKKQINLTRLDKENMEKINGGGKGQIIVRSNCLGAGPDPQLG